MDIAIYVAIAENGVIGREGGLPWRLSSDLKRFKAGTMGKPIIMGRKTWQGLGRPLPGRLNIVVTRDRSFGAEGAEVTASLADAITLAKARARCMAGADEICVIGGGEIYAQALPLADRLNVTYVLGEVDGDTRFRRSIRKSGVSSAPRTFRRAKRIRTRRAIRFTSGAWQCIEGSHSRDSGRFKSPAAKLSR